MVVGEAKKGVRIELGSTELLLPRSRWGAASDRIAEATYGTAVTVEIIEAPDQAGGTALSRVALDRSIRQPRRMDGQLRRRGSGFELVPADGSSAFRALVLDRLDPDSLVGGPRSWLVGALYRDLRLVEPA